MMPWLPAIVAASLLGSLHCAGMCGPLMAFACAADGCGRGATRGRTWLTVSGYHGARLLGYLSLGVVAGSLGQVVNLGGGALGLPRLATLAAGALMIFFGIAAWLRTGGVSLIPDGSRPQGVAKLLRWGNGLARGMQPVPRAAMIGLFTALMPCGWLYAFVVVAAATGSGYAGGAVMAAFWLGSVPLLTGLGLGARALSARFGDRLPLVTALVLVVLGLWTVFGRLAIPAFDPADLAASVHSAPGQALRVDHETLPCCQPRHAD